MSAIHSHTSPKVHSSSDVFAESADISAKEKSSKSAASPSILDREWRFIGYEKYDPYLKLAYNEVAANSVSAGGKSIIWLNGWTQSCVCVGSNQKISEVVNVDVANKLKIPIIRRQSSGGALYFDSEGELSWSIIAGNELLSKEFSEVQLWACYKIVDALDQLGIEAYYRAPNDVLTTVGKISVASFRRERDITFIEGTLLFTINLTNIQQLLRPENDSKSINRSPEKYRQLTSITGESEKNREEVIAALGAALTRGITVAKSSWSAQEIEDAEMFSKKYSSTEWVRH